jgi:NNP family nitrate/nitrite transporter-like MFS transporter
MDTFTKLWRAPEVNPINQKARSIPFLNPVSTTYGRTFFFSWFGFMIAFWSWYGMSSLILRHHHAYSLSFLRHEI